MESAYYFLVATDFRDFENNASYHLDPSRSGTSLSESLSPACLLPTVFINNFLDSVQTFCTPRFFFAGGSAWKSCKGGEGGKGGWNDERDDDPAYRTLHSLLVVSVQLGRLIFGVSSKATS